MPQNTYKIPFLLWGGGKSIGRPEIKGRLLGVIDYKLRGSPRIDLEVTALRNNPTYEGVDTEAFLSRSIAQGLHNKHKGRDIYYLPLEELATISKEVRE
jgi:hypothetical protein